MKSKYGANIEDKVLIDYFVMLVGRIYKMLPMLEKNDESLDSYFQSLMSEIAGGNQLILQDKYFLKLLFLLESLEMAKKENDYKLYRSYIFKCTNLCQRIVEDLSLGNKEKRVDVDEL